MLTQMDITTDGFGYMLSFGDLVWVPFTYGIQARYLAFHPVDLGLTASAAIVALNVVGFYIFRTSNSDKDSFRKHDNPKSRLFSPAGILADGRL
jgi:delta14-sterol reductase